MFFEEFRDIDRYFFEGFISLNNLPDNIAHFVGFFSIFLFVRMEALLALALSSIGLTLTQVLIADKYLIMLHF